MLNQQQAANIIQHKLNILNQSYKNTKVAIKTCIVYDFGWYFMNKVLGETLIGGPEWGNFIHKNGHMYELHYCAFPWDTGIGTHLDTKAIDNNGNPTPYAIRYFLKQVKMINIPIHLSFKTDSGYDLINATKYLKLNRCMPQDQAISWICKDSGINLNYRTYPAPYNQEMLDNFLSTFRQLVNTGLFTENWNQYYNTN
jgi:hypothetical protein